MVQNVVAHLVGGHVHIEGHPGVEGALGHLTVHARDGVEPAHKGIAPALVALTHGLYFIRDAEGLHRALLQKAAHAGDALLVQPLAVEDLPPFQYCMYNKNQMIYASSHRFFQHYSIIPDTLIHCGDPVINHTLVSSLENCASFVPSYFIGRIPSDTLRKLIFYAIDVPELSWELRVLYRRDSALGLFAREMIRLVRETPWRPLL